MKRILVAIPTYNERGNIERMVRTVLGLNENGTVKNLGFELSLAVIDDNSPDGTQDIVKSIMKEIDVNEISGRQTASNLFLISREKKLGLGTAYVSAFKLAIEKGFDYVITMDCDFSHDPMAIPGFMNMLKNSNGIAPDMISGSRYKNGIRIINWSMKRLLISYFANFYARTVSGIKISDLTGGFNLYNVVCLKNINLDEIKSKGYAFQIEMKFRMVKEVGCSFAEYPIIFYERSEGRSKMSKAIIFEAFFGVIFLKTGLYRILKIKKN